MTEPTAQVPVSLIEKALRLTDDPWLVVQYRALLLQPTPTAEPEHPRAQPIGVVARSIVHSLLTEADSDDIALWEDYPEIGENDWDEVIAAARSLAPAPPSDEEYRVAYAALDPSTIRDVTPPKDAS